MSEAELNNTVIARSLTCTLESTKLLKATRKRAVSTAVLKRLVRSLDSGHGIRGLLLLPLRTFAVVTGHLGPLEKEQPVILRQEGLTAAQCAGTTTDTSPARTSSSCDCLVGVTSSSLTHDLEPSVVHV